MTAALTATQVREELVSQLKSARGGRATSVNRSHELVQHLEAGLALHERQSAGDAAAERELDAWRRTMKQKTPPGSTFRGRPVNYTYADAKQIRKHLFGATPYAALQDDGLQHVIAVRCFGFFGGVCSVWVYFGVVDLLS